MKEYCKSLNSNIVQDVLRLFMPFGKEGFQDNGGAFLDDVFSFPSLKAYRGLITWNSNLLCPLWNPTEGVMKEDGSKALIWNEGKLHGKLGPWRFREYVIKSLKTTSDPMLLVMMVMKRLNCLPEKWYMKENPFAIFDWTTPR
jgi:hypothetical protein